jgi:D-beta-D-heptose 7-phosphate kinase/D-beta-D-heptose 1-phosphate adenosyltransferase
METAHACVVSDYAKGLVSPRMCERFIGLARQHGKPVLVDPKGTNFAKYCGATLVKPNLHEVERLFNHEIQQEDEVSQAGQRLLELLPGSAILMTRGQLGMSLFRQGSPEVHIASIARNVYDVTGAGDTVAGTLALALAAGADLEMAAHLANRAAGVVVGKLGTAQVLADELLKDHRFHQVCDELEDLALADVTAEPKAGPASVKPEEAAIQRNLFPQLCHACAHFTTNVCDTAPLCHIIMSLLI